MKVGPSTSLLVLTVPMSFVKINQCFESFDRRQEFFSFFFFFLVERVMQFNSHVLMHKLKS